MKPYGVNELRKMFLDYFQSKDHLVMKSFSLVPHNDNSLLLINSGMAPLKPYFTGQEIPPSRRVTTCQKCIRTGDIDEIGKTARHGTFFEMLGNFSFGDYFKKEAIEWTWDFLTEVIGLEKDRLYPSIYLNDEEAFEIWHDDIGIDADRIYRFGKEENFWEHGAGPCGPCSEVYYDRGEKYGCGKPTCGVGCDCDRYLEVWNDVFSQYESDGHGHYTTLRQKNIDTGMGLERLAVAVQDTDSLFTIDTNKALLDHVCSLSGKFYQTDHDTDVSLRIVADHIKSCTFMISDGIMPSNEGRGYVLRRLLRRAARHGRKLGISGTFLSDLSHTVIDLSKDGYPELDEKKEMIFRVLAEEEEKFDHTIDSGLSILVDFEKSMEENHTSVLSGEDAFRLYDTFGFPLDLTEEILAEKGCTVDQDSFDDCMKRQREMARAARKKTNYMGADVTVYQSIDPSVTSRFVGYDKLQHESVISVFATEDSLVEALADGDVGTIIVDETPFYATMGGQNADIGTIRSAGGTFVVKDTIRLQGGKIGHVGQMTEGMLRVGETVTLQVDEANRNATAKNHSATHLLQKCLRTVLGTHVEQAGSDVNAERLRFDFTHFQAMTPEEIKEVEEMVNQAIAAAYPVRTDEMPLEEAKKTGAMALFGEKYGDIVRVVNMGDFSLELCGGTHVKNTSQIGSFKIVQESGIAAGVRRIEAVTGDGVTKYYRNEEEELLTAAQAAKSTPADLAAKILSMQEEMRSLRSENEKLRTRLASEETKNRTDDAVTEEGISILAFSVKDVGANDLRNLGDQMKEKLGESVVVIASEQNGRVNLMATATEGAVKKGIHAGNLLKKIAPAVGGGGGGRANMAQAGGKNPGGIPEALALAKETAAGQLHGNQ